MPFHSKAASLRLAARMAEEAEAIGARIRERREELKLSQRELAEKMDGRTESKDVSRWENGKVLPRSTTLSVIAEALGTSVVDLRAGPMADRKEPEPGDLDQLSPNGSTGSQGAGGEIAKQLADLAKEVRQLRAQQTKLLARLAQAEASPQGQQRKRKRPAQGR